MKRLFVVFSVFIVASMLLFACGPKQTSPLQSGRSPTKFSPWRRLMRRNIPALDQLHHDPHDQWRISDQTNGYPRTPNRLPDVVALEAAS